MEIMINNDNNNAEAAADETQPPSANNNKNDEEDPQGSSISMTGHYGSKASALHVLSLLLNTALMIYAHLSPLGEVYSSQNPELTSSLLPASERALASSLLRSRVTQQQAEDSEAAATTTATEGKCNNEDDLQNWVLTQGNTQRPVMSNYCSREWLGDGAATAPCFLNATCIELCFVQVYKYTTECASCFSVVPECSVAAGCITSW
jgi:hypothetical protein